MPLWSPQDVAARLDEVVIVAKSESLIGLVESASQGVVEGEALAYRPILRPGDVLEFVPGVVVTQHSGAGKANQFFLRGFNLDHGTDLLTTFEGAPVNAPSHGHGQGYTDLNFLLPELLESISYRKGPYAAEVGDFGSAGALDIRYVRALERPIARVTLGADDYARAFAADSTPVRDGTLLMAVEAFQYDGPWTNPDDYERFNGVARWSTGDERAGLSLLITGMDGQWNATDQIPARAVASGALARFDAVDPTDGGESDMALLVGEWRRSDALSASRVSASARQSHLNLWSNFTYFLVDTLDGDQFEQVDERETYGLDARHEFVSSIGGRSVEHSFGVQARGDLIENALYSTKARARLATTREDEIEELAFGLWYQNELEWTRWLRSVAGVRGDVYRFDVESDDARNSGDEEDALASAKLSLVLAPWVDTEVYANAGQGFHSNDARGATTTVDPVSGTTVEPVDPLVRTEGAEVGARAALLEGWNASASLWVLDSDSEIVFVGDAGTTEASRPSRRVGVEFASDWKIGGQWLLDLDAAWSRARFTDSDPSGDHVPGALRTAVAAGLTWLPREDVYCSLRGRHFGPRDLLEDASVRSSESTLVHLQAGWRVDDTWSLELGVFNLFDEQVADVEYVYESLLPGETAPAPGQGIADKHFHPAEERTLRFSVAAHW